MEQTQLKGHGRMAWTKYYLKRKMKKLEQMGPRKGVTDTRRAK